ncbi:MAG: zinc ABC transporter substrate-binding protein [Rhizobiaceae bacterium]
MRFVKSLLLSAALFSTTTLAAQADVKVVASIKPVHSLVAAVMEGVAMPSLIVDGAGSPHTYALKPSQAQDLQDAELVFWMGHQLEAFLEKPIEAIAGKAKAVELLDAHDLVNLKFREGGAFDEHGHEEGKEDEHSGHDDHNDHDEHKHDEHAEEKDHDTHKHDERAEEKDHDEHKHEEHAEGESPDEHKHDEHAEDEDHKDHDEHAHGEYDPHVWLDPVNAKALVHEIEEALVETDSDNAKKYEANAKAVMAKIDALTAEVSADLAPVKGRGFVVFHDAYQHFESRFGLAAVGSVTVSPEVIPGAERIGELRAKVKGLKAACVFSEPQFESKLVSTVSEGTDAKPGVLDPLGTGIENGPELYFMLIRNMAASFKSCLSEAS